MNEVTRHDRTQAERLYAKPASSALTEKPEKHSRRLSELSDQGNHKLMIALWQRMSDLFGVSWETQYGDVDGTAIKSWSRALADFTTEQLGRGIRACENWQKNFPPTLPQFKELCLTVKHEKPNFTQRRMAAEKTSVMGHLESSAKSEVAKREVERMRAIMDGEEVETRAVSYMKMGLQRRWGPLNG